MGNHHSTKSTIMFTGVHPVTETEQLHHTGTTSASFVIPPNYKEQCMKDNTWCRHFIDEAIKNLQIPSLFPGATAAKVADIPPGLMSSIKKICKRNLTCYNLAITAQINRMTEDFIMQRFHPAVTGSSGNPLPTWAIIAASSVVLAIIGGLLLFYYVFSPSILSNEGSAAPGLLNFAPYPGDDPIPRAPMPPPPPQASGSRSRGRSKPRRARASSSRRSTRKSKTRKSKARKKKKAIETPRSVGLRPSRKSRSKSKARRRK